MYEIEVRELDEQPTAVVRGRVGEDHVGSWFAEAYARVAKHLQDIDVPTVGMPFARCAKDATGYDVEAGLPVAHPIADDEDIEGAALPGGPAATTWHHGSYATAEPAYAAIAAWLADEGRETTETPWEVYHGDPSTGPNENSWRTEVIQPCTG
jgi:effector-binding domain-containing protein